MKYVALSRATTHAFVLTNSPINQGTVQETVQDNVNDYEVYNDSQIDTSKSVDLRPSFETLLSKGRVESQGFYLTLEEFNSMSKEEQDNFKKCL